VAENWAAQRGKLKANSEDYLFQMGMESGNEKDLVGISFPDALSWYTLKLDEVPVLGWKVGVACEREGPIAVSVCLFGVFMGMYGAILSCYHLGGYVFSYVFCVC